MPRSQGKVDPVVCEGPTVGSDRNLRPATDRVLWHKTGAELPRRRPMRVTLPMSAANASELGWPTTDASKERSRPKTRQRAEPVTHVVAAAALKGDPLKIPGCERELAATDVISLTKAFDSIHMILWWHMTSYNVGKAGACRAILCAKTCIYVTRTRVS